MMICLTTESIEGSALSLEGIDNIHGSDSLPLGVFSVGDSITDDILKEDLEDALFGNIRLSLKTDRENPFDLDVIEK
jgi:hypothetical protein